MISRELKWLWKKVRPLRPLLYAQLSAVVFTSILGLLDPLIVKWLIDDVLPWHRDSMLIVVTVVFAGTYFFLFGFNSLAFLLDTYFSQRMLLAVRLHLLRHLQRLSADFFVKTPPGDVLHRLEQDVNQLRELGGGTLASVVRIVLSTSLTLVILMILSWKLTLLVLPLVPLVLYLRHLGYPRLRRASDDVVAASAARSAFLQDHVQSIPQIQLLGREAGERRRFVALARRSLRSMVKRRGLELLLEHNTSMAMMLATALVLGYGGSQVLDGSMTVGGLVAFYSYLSRIFGPTQTLVTLYSALQRSEASIRRLMELLDVESSVEEPRSPVELADRGPLEAALEDVHFAYGAEPILDGVSLHVEPGTKVALVGFSGSGKSTLARLLVRLYDPQRGRVLLDGVSTRDVALRHLRRRVALVLQEPLLFDATLRDNLLYADPHAGDDRLREVLRLVQLERTVDELPEGLDTRLGVRGQKLSGGQKQRLAVARAVLQRPRLLILDEATAGLDGVTEQNLLRALDRLLPETTVLLIAHRLSAIRWAERIVVLDGGRVVGEGTHDQLYRRSALYRDLCDKQLRSSSVETDPAQPPAAAETAAPEPRAAKVVGL